MSSRTIPNRPPLTESVQQFNATEAQDLIGIKAQTIADGAAGPTGDVQGDFDANLIVSLEDTNPVTLIPPDLTDPGTAWIQRTFVQLGTQNVQIIPPQPIVAFPGVELAAVGSSATVVPYILEGTGPIWLVVATFGTVNIIP